MTTIAPKGRTTLQQSSEDSNKPAAKALITGAGSGIGQACAAALAAKGYDLLLLGRRAEPLEQTARQWPAAIIQADLSSEPSIEAAATKAGPKLDVLIHAAAQFQHGPIAATTAPDWRAINAVNIEGPLLLTSRCLPALQQAGGTVVFINSTAALNPGANAGAYAASKAALRAAADALRQEVNAVGVRVLTVFPGRTDTPMQDTVLAAEGRSLNRASLLAPCDIAAMVAAALALPPRAQVSELVIRPTRPG